MITLITDEPQTVMYYENGWGMKKSVRGEVFILCPIMWTGEWKGVLGEKFSSSVHYVNRLMTGTWKITKSCIRMSFQTIEISTEGRAKRLKIIHLGNWTQIGEDGQKSYFCFLRSCWLFDILISLCMLYFGKIIKINRSKVIWSPQRFFGKHFDKYPIHGLD